MSDARSLLILGGGVAGLSAGFYARRLGWPSRIIEAGPAPGGNARTLEHGPFRFDTGAHRFHDRFPDITADVKELLGAELMEVDAPSQIYADGRFVDFPLKPLNVIQSLGPSLTVRAICSLASARLASAQTARNFEASAVRSYGRTIAELFLLNYSQKLWGIDCQSLSPAVAGTRLTGLSARAMLREFFWKSTENTRHLDGRFFYPRRGIGSLADGLAAACDPKNLSLNSRVTRVTARAGRIVSVEVAGNEHIDTERTEVVSTLPLTILAQLLTPALPDSLVAASRSLRFRHVVLVTLFLDRPSVSRNATLYFPESQFLFTRVSEPRNRSAQMSPAGRTSLSVEIPCFASGEAWTLSDAELIERIVEQLRTTGLVRPAEGTHGVVHRIPNAYPILEVGAEAHVSALLEYFARFENLHIAGRGGLFDYTWLHNQMRSARELVTRLSGKDIGDSGRATKGRKHEKDGVR
jgi:protoporphyrinogen oxidase